MTTPTAPPVDAITGNPVTAEPLARHVVLDAGDWHTWLTPAMAVALAEQLHAAAAAVLNAADDIEAAQ